jgi:site-specific DNA-cytosine methylase
VRVLELFAGIGGAAAGLPLGAQVVAAVDHDRAAVETYQGWLPHPVFVKNLEFVKPEWFAAFDASLWWMSPPCQPHGIRGHQRDLDDPRSRAFVAVVRAIAAVRPRAVALENVPWFEDSASYTLLRETLEAAGYSVAGQTVCTSRLGLPVARRRFYLLARRDGPVSLALSAPAPLRPIRDFLLPNAPVDLDVDAETRARFGAAMHVVERDDGQAVAACFTAAYGRSPVYCGSYLRDGDRLRRFAPEEIARLHGFPLSFRFPDGMRLARRWAQVGHSVPPASVAAILRAAGLGEGAVSPPLPRDQSE